MTVTADRLMLPQQSRALNRVIAASIGAHLLVVLFVAFAPRDWFNRESKEAPTMVISLAGAPGPQTGGFSALGGQAKVKDPDPPKRPEPTPVAATKPTPTASTVQAPKPATPPKTDPKAPPDVVTRPPVTGRETVAGTAKTDTGVKGEGTGLSQGGGGAEVEVNAFCCWPYIEELRNRILPLWNQNQTEKGQTVLRFEIARDGKLLKSDYFERSGSGILDRAAMSALRSASLPALPKEFEGQTLTIRLTFVYKGP